MIHILRHALLLTTTAFILTAQAEILKVEDFHYPIGTTLESTANWSTPWGGASGMTITTPLFFEGYSEAENAGSVLLDGDCGAYQPHMPFTQITSGCVYTAFLLYPYANYKTGWFLSYRQEAASNTSDFTYIGRVSLSDANEIGLRYFKNAPAVYDTENMLSPTKVYLCVLKYEIIPGKNNDEVSLFVFDKMPLTEPAQPTIGPLRDSKSPDITPSQLVLRSYNADSWLSIGAIRVATTFEEAVGLSETDIHDLVDSDSHPRKYIHHGSLIIEVNEQKYTVLHTGL